MGFRPTHMDPSRVVLATLDEEGRIVDVARAGAGGLGLPEPDASTVLPRLRELAHPEDATVLDELLGRHSSGGVPDTFTLRLRGARREWVSTRVTVSPLSGPVTPRFGLVVWPIHPEELASEAARLACLEDQLDRIRQVVQDQNQEIAPGSVDLGELTLRQQEIVARLLGGHRVDAIARALYVSPSTVRNHLSSIFEKLGVASQSELVELLRGYEFGARVGTGLGHK